MATCKNCGEDYELGTGVNLSSVEDGDQTCGKCKSSTKKRRRRVYVPTKCEPIPTGIHPCGCNCQPCYESKKAAIVYSNPETCDTFCGLDETGLETYQGKKYLPKGPAACYPFTKDAFARINRTFGFPKLGGVARTEIINVVLTEGQPITHDNYGTLIAHPIANELGMYNLENAELANNGLDVIGKPVPCGKEFYFGYPQCACSVEDQLTLECNALIEDFTVPAVGLTAEAVIKSYLDIAIDDIVVIRNKVDPSLVFRFRVSGATGANTLILENQGSGGIVGNTYTAASDVEGEFAWCVAPLVDQSACAQSTDTTCIFHILGCNEDGQGKKIRGTIENEALLYDPVCDGWTPKVVSKPIVCVLLDSCFQVAPVEDVCNRIPITITTLEDQKLLDNAAAALLSDNAQPLITICGYVFSLDLINSVVGALVVTPDFNPDEIVNFDRNCKVCVPEDCCFQCAPQVHYPVEAYFPPGKNQALTVVIPNDIITVFGEYKLSVAKRPDDQTNILLVHDNTTNIVTAAYDATGATIVLGTLPGDPNEYSYNMLDYCQQESTCPVDASYEEDINVRFYDLVYGEQISFNYHTQFDVYQCYEVGSPGEALTSTQYGIMGHFVGPSKTSEIAFGDELFGQVAPEPDGFKTYDAISNFKKRTFALFYPTCVRITTNPTILLLVEDLWETIADSWVYLSASSVTVATGAEDRYGVGDKVKFIGETGTQQQTIISVITDNTLTFVDAVVPNELLYDKFIQKLSKDKILQMETTSMFRTQII